MTKSTTSFLFPDLNVRLALSVQSHLHHRTAIEWLESLPHSQRLCFCRFTQMGLLRLLTTEQLMGADEVITHVQASVVYDEWIADERVLFLAEPENLEESSRSLTQLRQAASKAWPDSYLISFARTAGLHLVTFDTAMARKAGNAIELTAAG